MHPDSTFLRRVFLAAMLGAAMLALAPGAATQTLVSRVGDPVPYQIQLPALARISGDGEMLQAETDDFIVVVAAMDMMAEDKDPLPVSEAEARRILTNVVIGSDSLLLAMMEEGAREQNLELSDVVKEIRTLGGQRSGWMRGRTTCSCGHEVVIETYVTVKDGIVYMLMFGGYAENAERRAPLIARIHESFILADAPPAATVRTRARGSTIRRIERSR
ncbi:MAG TPA: hypothetical protein VEQ60_09630 [Longimicrobium sp.]|nr:hypothetical protein [Longimicrobium sp.]